MLFKQSILDRIATGEVTLAFRRWRRPSVRAGGTLRTSVGVLNIAAVTPRNASDLSALDAQRAGFASLSELLADVATQRDGVLYEIQFFRAGPDPRHALREQVVATECERDAIRHRLLGFDSRSRNGAWTLRVLQAIDARPGEPARRIADATGFDKEWLKLQIRKLKDLGLTESLPEGYRLSPRGRSYLLSHRSNP